MEVERLLGDEVFQKMGDVFSKLIEYLILQTRPLLGVIDMLTVLSPDP